MNNPVNILGIIFPIMFLTASLLFFTVGREEESTFSTNFKIENFFALIFLLLALGLAFSTPAFTSVSTVAIKSVSKIGFEYQIIDTSGKEYKTKESSLQNVEDYEVQITSNYSILNFPVSEKIVLIVPTKAEKLK